MASRPLEGSPKPENKRPDPENTTTRRWAPSFKALAVLIFLTVGYYTFCPATPTSPSFENNVRPPSGEQDFEILPDTPRPRAKKPLSAFYKRPGGLYKSYSEAEWEDEEFFFPMKRYSLSYGKVACWQNNGVWIKYLTPVEMDFLGVNRFQDTDRAPEHMQADEDAFCTRLRALGASFWKLPPVWPLYVNGCWTIDSCVDPVKMASVEVGFPTNGSGVWVLDTGNKGWNWPKTVSLRNALTMDERCKVIQEYGGVFCENPTTCPEMARLLEGLEG